jgi:AraC-like DNA-binding protein
MDCRFWTSASTACTVAHWNNDVAHEPWSKLYLLRSGAARYAVARPGEAPAWTALRPGRIYLIPGGRRQINACTAGFSLAWCHFTTQDEDLGRRLSALDRLLDLPVEAVGATVEIVAGASQSASGGLRAAALVLQLLATLPDPPVPDALENQRRRLAPALTELEYRFAQPLPVGRLAALAGLKPSRFQQVFRQVHGTSVHGYQLELRFAEAQRLLLDGTLGVQAIAQRCGYASAFTFSRLFAARFGVPPSRFRAIGLG